MIYDKKIYVLIFLVLPVLFSSSVYHVREKSLQATEVAPFGAAFSNVVYASVQEASTANPVCGNGVVETGEQCDAGGSNGACPATCSASCTANSCGGGGGGGGGFIAPVSSVIFSGRAYPKSTIVLLKDAQIAATTVADEDAIFQISVSGLSGGNYIFAVYSEDNKGIRSSLLTFSVDITPGAIVQMSDVLITPTIMVDKSEVKRGDDISIFGQSAPDSEVTISVNSDEGFLNTVKAAADGAYLYNFDTAPLDKGQHFTKSKAALNGKVSSFSKVVSFVVGTKTVFTQLAAKFLKGDLNNDGRVNLVDFSVAAYWHKRPLSAELKLKEMEWLNGDGKVDLVDFSIMAFHWTG